MRTPRPITRSVGAGVAGTGLVAFGLVTWIGLAPTAESAPGNAPPRCAIRLPDGPIEVGIPVTFRGGAIDPDGGELSYTWHFGGAVDATVSGTTSSGVPFSEDVVLEVGGQAYTVGLTVTDADGHRTSCYDKYLVGEAPGGGRPPVPERPEPISPLFQDHALFAFNDLGMHCADLGSAPFTILPPFNTLNAQVFARRNRPRALDDVTVRMQYSAASNPDDPVVFDPLSEPPSINSTSRNFPLDAPADDAQLRKTDFWDPLDPTDPDSPTIVETLFGANPPPDEGLASVNNIFIQADPGPPPHVVFGAIGRRMPGIDDPYRVNSPQNFSRFLENPGWFKAEGIPITAVDDFGRDNSYPLMRVEAIDRATGEVLAAIDTVVPVSTEVDCRDCHTRGLVGADPDARADDLDFVDPNDPFDRASIEKAAKTNILLLHDYKHQFDDGGEPNYEPALADQGAVLCAACHNSFALEEATGGALVGDPELNSMSAVMHGFHGLMKIDAVSGELVRDRMGEPLLAIELDLGEGRLFPVDPLDPDVTMEQNCFQCHPGQLTQCFRGAMFDAGLKCSNCHGDMLAMGGVFEGDFDHSGSPRERLPWRDEPRCESCHLGDAVSPGEGRMLARLAFDLADQAAVPILASNPRFAEHREPAPDGGLTLELYRNSFDSHGGNGRDSHVACEACHGSPHAIWANSNPAANDNVTANQLQGHSGTILECSVCHLPGAFGDGTLDGPHGMHPVNDRLWIEEDGHGEFAKDWSNGDPCASCHGVDHLGTRLAVTPIQRDLRDEGGEVLARVEAGDQIRCNLCHSLEKSFDRD